MRSRNNEEFIVSHLLFVDDTLIFCEVNGYHLQPQGVDSSDKGLGFCDISIKFKVRILLSVNNSLKPACWRSWSIT